MLMALLRDYLVDERAEILDNDIRLIDHRRHRSRLPDFVREPLDALHGRLGQTTRGMTLCLALSYGGREAIVDAARALVERGARGRDSPRRTSTRVASREALSTQRAAAARPRHPHLGRAAALELPALGSGLRRALLHRHAVARLPRASCSRALDAFQGRERRFGLTSEQVRLRRLQTTRSSPGAVVAPPSPPPKKPLGNLAARLLTVALVIPLLVLAIHWSNPIGVALVVLTASVVGLREWMQMTLPPAGGESAPLTVTGGSSTAECMTKLTNG